MHAAITGRLRQGFQIKLGIGWNRCHANSISIARRHQSPKHLFGGQADFCSHSFGREVLGIDGIFAQLLTDAHLFQQPNCVGLVGHAFDSLSLLPSDSTISIAITGAAMTKSKSALEATLGSPAAASHPEQMVFPEYLRRTKDRPFCAQARPDSLADGRRRLSAGDDQLFDHEARAGLHRPDLAKPVMIEVAVRSALPSGQLITVGLHFAVPVDNEADPVLLRCCLLIWIAEIS